MDCQTLTVKRGLIRCTHWDKCHTLKICLCETDSDLPLQRRRTKKTPWPARRQQLLNFARQHETIDTAMIMKHTNAANGTACNWLKYLVNEGELIRLTRATLGGVSSRPATFAIAQGD